MGDIAPSTIKFQIPREEHVEEEAHTASIYAFQIRGNRMVTASADKTIRRWDLDTSRLIPPVIDGSPLITFASSVVCLQFDHEVIISGAADGIDGGGMLAITNFSTGLTEKILPHAHDETVLALHFNDRLLVTSSKDKKVKIWNRRAIHDVGSLPQWLTADYRQSGEEGIAEYSLLGTLSIHHAAVNAVLFSDQFIISGSGDRQLRITDFQTGQLVHSLDLGRGIADMIYNGRLLLLGCSDNTATIYDTSSNSVKAKLKGHRNLVRGVDAISDHAGNFVRVVTGSYDGTLRIWEKDASKRTSDTEQSEGQEPWFVKTTFEYGEQPERISDSNPYIHQYVQGDRVFDVTLHEDRVFCSGQGNVVVGWSV